MQPMPFRPAPVDSAQGFASPKRKRETEDIAGSPRGAMRPRTDLPVRSLEDEFSEPQSPRTNVSNQLQSLQILDSQIPLLDFGRKHEDLDRVNRGLSSSKVGNLGCDNMTTARTKGPKQVTLEDSAYTISTSTRLDVSSTLTTNPEPPSTPTLHPISPLDPTARTISPLPTTAVPPAISPLPRGTPPPTAESHTIPHSLSPRSSPPASISELVWQESEITGHSPDDPTDDGYGINGIGFRPTAAMAQARTRRRRQQVAEWKSREAREARQRRMDRRRGSDNDSGHANNDGSGVVGTEERKVRFVDPSSG